MVDFSQLDTSEKVTRFLRNKTSKPFDLIEVATNLVEGSLDVFLPQKEVVVLQWLFDYLSDKKNASNRVNAGFWEIFNITWKALSKDQDTLSRIYLSNNFVGILSETFFQIVAQYNDAATIQNLLTAITNSLTELDKCNLWFKLRMDNFVSLVDSYTKLIIHAKRTVKSEDISFDSTSLLISNMVKSSLSSSSDLKKLSSVFNSKIMSSVFAVLSSNIEGDTLLLFNTLVSSLITTIDDKTAELELKSVNDAVTSFNLSKEETEQSTINLFKVIVKSWPNKSANAFSQLRVISPSALKPLVSISAENKIKLDSEFLESTISQIFDKKDKTSVDWELLLFIHNIDESFLTDRKWLLKILSAPAGQKNLEQFQLFAETLIDYFTNSRELPQFILSWKRNLDSSCWNDVFISEYLSTKVRSLSTIQLQSLLNALVSPLKRDDDSSTPDQLYLPIIVCVFSFFQQPTLPSSNLFEPLFDVLRSTQFSTSPIFWKIKYLILSISSGFVTKFHTEVLSQAEDISYGLKNDDDELAEGIMQTLFRISEFVEVPKFKKYSSKLLKYIGKTANNSVLFFDSICDRWLFLVNNKFSKKHKEKLVTLFATDKNSFNKLCASELFYEQQSLSLLVLDNLGDKSELKKEIARIKIIATMPLPVIKITRRRKIIDSLTLLALPKDSKKPKPKDDASELELQLAIRSALDHLLSNPTLAVSLVSDYKVFQKYFQSSNAFENTELDRLTHHTCDAILNYHNKNYTKSEVSAIFLKNLVEQEVSTLSSEDSTNFNELNFATMVVSILDAELLVPAKKKQKSLDQVVIERLGSTLKSSKKIIAKDSSKELFEALHAMRNLATLSVTKAEELSKLDDVLKTTGAYATYVIKKLGTMNSSNTEFNDLKNLAQSCFIVLAHLSSSKEEIETSLVYYMTFLEFDAEASLKDLVYCVKKLKEQDFAQLLQSIASSTTWSSTTAESAPPFANIKTIEAFLRACKDEESTSISESLCLFLSNVLKNSSLLSEKDLLAYLDLAEFAVKDRSKLVTPFALELMISIFVQACTTQFGPRFTPSTGSPDLIYGRLVETASSTIVFNRNRLSGKYHILTQLLTALLGCLTNNSLAALLKSTPASDAKSGEQESHAEMVFHPTWVTSCTMPFTERSGEAYTRLIGNISSSSVSYKETSEKNRLTSYTQALKRHLSLFIGVVLINYVRFSLQEGFSSVVRRGLVPGVYIIFNTIGHEQLKNVNLQLDSNSRPYFKTLYEDYMAHGKWRSD